MPKPPRTTVLLSPRQLYANPTRGATAVSYFSLDRVGRVDNGRRVEGRIEEWIFGRARALAV
jgi:hypothetical protein